MEVNDGFDLSPMKGEKDKAILIGMCSSMGCPHNELVPYTYTSSKPGFLLFDVDHRIVVSFVVVELRELSELIIQ